MARLVQAEATVTQYMLQWYAEEKVFKKRKHQTLKWMGYSRRRKKKYIKCLIMWSLIVRCPFFDQMDQLSIFSLLILTMPTVSSNLACFKTSVFSATVWTQNTGTTTNMLDIRTELMVHSAQEVCESMERAHNTFLDFGLVFTPALLNLIG